MQIVEKWESFLKLLDTQWNVTLPHVFWCSSPFILQYQVQCVKLPFGVSKWEDL